MAKGKIDNVFSEQMVRHARRFPAQTRNTILTNALRPLGIVNHNTSHLRHFGIRIDPNLIIVRPHRYEPPALTYGSNHTIEYFKQVNKKTYKPATWSLSDVSTSARGVGCGFLSTPHVNIHPTLYILRICTANSLDAVNHLRDTIGPELTRILRLSGINFPGIAVQEAIYHPNRYIFQARLDVARSNFNVPNNTIPITLVVLPDKSPKIFSDLKWWGDCHAGIPTICLVNDNQVNMAAIRNIAGNLR